MPSAVDGVRDKWDKRGVLPSSFWMLDENEGLCTRCIDSEAR